jgi:hypothetical protein
LKKIGPHQLRGSRPSNAVEATLTGAPDVADFSRRQYVNQFFALD